jgi:ABC-2 type transport system ATP-binding protein
VPLPGPPHDARHAADRPWFRPAPNHLIGATFGGRFPLDGKNPSENDRQISVRRLISVSIEGILGMNMPTSAISVRGLRKSFKDKLVLDGIDLDITAGTVFSLLGPNGAGKTTTVRILSTLSAPDSGQARIAGKDLAGEPDAVRAAIGVTGQFAAVDGLLTGFENLMLMGRLHHLGKRESRQRATALLERFDLAEAAGASLATYSGGMRRRLDLAMTLVGRPRIIFLDEPTTGLDPRSRRTMWQIIRDLVGQDGVTIFLTTQYLEEADQLADRIAVLDRGRLVAEGTSTELKQLVPGGHVSLRFTDAAGLDLAARTLGTISRDEEELTIQVPSDGSVRSLRTLLDRLGDANLEPAELTVHTPDLDDVFLALTDRSAAAPHSPAALENRAV